MCTGNEPDTCLENVRYNAINTAEACCEACESLKYLPTTHSTKQAVDFTPCVAFQIVDGKCRILREKYVTKYFPTQSVTDVMDMCPGFKDSDKCHGRDANGANLPWAIRNDDIDQSSHGYWGTCNENNNPTSRTCTHRKDIDYRTRPNSEYLDDVTACARIQELYDSDMVAPIVDQYDNLNYGTPCEAIKTANTEDATDATACIYTAAVSVNNDCNYFSHIYYRDLNGRPSFPKTDSKANDTYRKIEIVSLPKEGINVTMNVSFFTDRTIKRTKLTNAPSGNDLPTGTKLTDNKIGGYTHENNVDNGVDVKDDQKHTRDSCAQIAIYLKSTNVMTTDVDTGMEVFDNTNTGGRKTKKNTPMTTSNQCCQSDAAADGVGCNMNLNLTREFVKEMEGERRRRLNGGDDASFIVSYECVGNGRDLCDHGVTEGGNFMKLSQTTGGGTTGGGTTGGTTTGGTTDDTGTVCCEALTLSCVACSDGKTSDEYCIAYPKSQYCETSTTDDSNTASSETPSDSTTAEVGSESPGSSLMGGSGTLTIGWIGVCASVIALFWYV